MVLTACKQLSGLFRPTRIRAFRNEKVAFYTTIKVNSLGRFNSLSTFYRFYDNIFFSLIVLLPKIIVHHHYILHINSIVPHRIFSWLRSCTLTLTLKTSIECTHINCQQPSMGRWSGEVTCETYSSGAGVPDKNFTATIVVHPLGGAV